LCRKIDAKVIESIRIFDVIILFEDIYIVISGTEVFKNDDGTESKVQPGGITIGRGL